MKLQKTFTLDKSLVGPDHKASIDEAQLKEIVYSIKIKRPMEGTMLLLKMKG